MANPLGGAPMPPVNPFFELIKQIRSGKATPQSVIQMLVNNNPQIAQRIDRLKMQKGGNVSYQDLAMEVMRERGIDPNAFLSQFK